MMASNGDFPSCGVFSYCSNDPVNGSDPSGMSEFQDNYMMERAKYFARWGSGKQDEYKRSRYPDSKYGSGKQEEYYYSHNPVQRVLYDAYNTIKKNVSITYSRGITVSAGGYNVTIGVASDTKGHLAPQITFTSGIGTGNFTDLSFGIYQTVTNAPGVDKLDGYGIQCGGSAGTVVEGVPIFAGADLNIIPDGSKVYGGVTSSFGVGSPGVDIHVQQGYTWSGGGYFDFSYYIDKAFYQMIGW